MKFAVYALFLGFAQLVLTANCSGALEVHRHPVPREHPRLLGSLDELRALAPQRQAECQRVVRVARNEKADGYSWIMSAALVAAIEGDDTLAQKVHSSGAMKFVQGLIRRGHTLFANDLALCGIACDLCHGAWSEADQQRR